MFRTDRLELRFYAHADAPSLLAALDADRPSLLPWMPWSLKECRNLPEVYFSIERMRRDRERTVPTADDFALGIFDRADGAVVGGTGLHRMNLEAAEAEIGYWIRGDRASRGLCTEAIGGLITWGFTSQAAGGWGLRRLHIRCAGQNAASRRVPAKLGLRQELHIKDARWVDGLGYDDALGWGVLADEWDIAAGRLRPA